MTFSPARRNFLWLAGAGTAGLLSGCGRDTLVPGPELEVEPTEETPQEKPPVEEPVIPPEGFAASAAFPMGVSSGDVTATSAVLWTRYVGIRKLRCVVWEMDGERYARVAGKADCDVTEAGFVHVDVQNLQAAMRYRYVFYEMDGDKPLMRSTIARFRACPAPDSLEPLTFGAVSCVKYGHSFATLMRAAERDDLDAFLLLGDTVYNDGAISLEQYRDSWYRSMSSPEWVALRSSTSLFSTWDDHEVDDDWAPSIIDSDNMRMATQAWFENLPVRRHATSANRVYRSIRWGKTVELFALDCRSERKLDDGLYLSRAQMDWLKAGLAESPAVFKIILNSVPIGEFPWPFTLWDSSRWNGYPKAREEILTHVEKQKVRGVLWLSGDFHLGSMGNIAATGLGASAVEVLAGPGANSANPGTNLVGGRPFDFVTGESNYVSLHLNPATRDCRVVFHNGAGRKLADKTYRIG